MIDRSYGTCFDCGKTAEGMYYLDSNPYNQTPQNKIPCCKKCAAKRYTPPKHCNDCGKITNHLKFSRCSNCYRLYKESLPVTAENKCSVDGCYSVKISQGYCRRHYKQLKRGYDPQTYRPIEREQKVLNVTLPKKKEKKNKKKIYIRTCRTCKEEFKTRLQRRRQCLKCHAKSEAARKQKLKRGLAKLPHSY